MYLLSAIFSSSSGQSRRAWADPMLPEQPISAVDDLCIGIVALIVLDSAVGRHPIALTIISSTLFHNGGWWQEWRLPKY